MEEVNVPRVRVLQSKIIELAGFLYVLADPDNHDQFKDLARRTKNTLTDDLSDVLTNLSDLQLHGFELIEFLLDFKIYDDLLDLEHSVQRLDNLRFYTLFFGIENNPEPVAKSLENPKKTTSYFKKISWISKNPDTLRRIFESPEKFRLGLFSLLKKLDTEEFNQALKKNERLFQNSISFMNQELTTKTPLDLAQDLMGKTYKRIGNYREYIFIPSFCFNKKAMRFMDDDTLILVNPMLKQLSYEDERKKVISSLKIMSDQTRFEILRLLMETPLYGKQIADRLGLTTPTISHHLEQLKSVGLIREERVKNLKYFSSNPGSIDDFLSKVKHHLLK